MTRDKTTEEELDRMIAENLPTMPPGDVPSDAHFNSRNRGASELIRACLGDGKGRTIGQIAAATGLTTRDVNQIVCKVVRLAPAWVRRDGKGPKQGGTGFVYFLAKPKK